MLVLSYQQVMPKFLDFIFPLGKQMYPQDFHFSGFCVENHMSSREMRAPVQERARSGRGYEMCYSLKSVERFPSQEDWPWSIRHTSIYHEFDIETGRSVWIVVKGSNLMKQRVESESKLGKNTALNSLGTTNQAFAASLATHLLFCDWSVENWRWYINFLEEEVQKKTSGILSIPISPPENPVFERPSRSTTQSSKPEGASWRSILSKNLARISRSPSPAKSKSSETKTTPNQPPELPLGRPNERTPNKHHEFSFSDLQRIQYIEERLNESLLVLKVNEEVIGELAAHYHNTVDSRPEKLRQDCELDLALFAKRIDSLQNVFRVQQSRTESLISLLANRKSLVSRRASLSPKVANIANVK